MPNKYKRKPSTVKAQQYLTEQDAADIVLWISEKGLDARASMIMGTNAKPVYTIVVPDKRDGTVYANPGDWVVREGGRFRVVNNDTFHGYYEPVGDGD